MEIKSIIIISTTIIICLTIIVFGIMGVIAFHKAQKGTAKSFGLMFQRGNFLRIATVIMVVVAIIYLGVAGIIKDNGIIGVLSGVAGYVLGGLEKNGNGSEENDE